MMEATSKNFKNNLYIIGIDEVGRGPLAGPVVVAGVKLATSDKVLAGIRDSKKLSPKQRDKWFLYLTSHPKVAWGCARVWPKKIDQINISQAANLAAYRVFKKISRGVACLPVLDGGLYLPHFVPHRTVIKGDEKIPEIAAASIIAKVTRDRTMVRLHKKYPQYRFDLHKGYATVLHRELVKVYGYSEVHRKSFKIDNIGLSR